MHAVDQAAALAEAEAIEMEAGVRKENDTLQVWSVTWLRKNQYCEEEQRKWFATEREAQCFMDAYPKRKGLTGPHRHVVDGDVGLMSFATTYCQ